MSVARCDEHHKLPEPTFLSDLLPGIHSSDARGDEKETRADKKQDVTLSTLELAVMTPSSDQRQAEYVAFEQSMPERVVEHLMHRIGSDRFEMWFGSPAAIKHAENSDGVSIVVMAENLFSLSRIKSTFGTEIRSIVDRVCGSQVGIEFRVEDQIESSECSNSAVAVSVRIDGAIAEASEGDPAESGFVYQQTHFPGFEPAPARRAAARQSERTVNRNQRNKNGDETAKRHRGMKSFWFGEENRLAEASVEQLLKSPGQFSPFFVYGPTGSGKTHLLESIAADFRSRLRLKRCVMLSAEQFTSSFVASLRGGSGLPLFRRKYRDLDLLVIDDIQFLAGKRATLNEFHHTVDNLFRAGKQVVVSADRPPIELSALGGDLGTRLNAGLSCPLRYPGMEGRVKIAQQFCAERNMKISPHVIELICERLTRDVRRISGALNRLHAFTLSTNRPVTIEIAQQELNELFTGSCLNSASLLTIETAVCELYGIKPVELKSNSRHKQVCTARMLAMYLSRQYTSSAFAEIGSYFGGRSHSTVIAAQKKVSQWIEEDAGLPLPHATYRAKEVIGRLESSLRLG